MLIKDNGNTKIIRSKHYNMDFYRFNRKGSFLIPDGTLIRWGKTLQDDPFYSPSPEIADIEISSGKCNQSCAYCYKSNSSIKELKNMSLETYKTVLDKLLQGQVLTQVALGLTGVKDNPDLLAIMEYTLRQGCFPNFTLTGSDLDHDMASDLAGLCGALAVSCTPINPELCFDVVEEFVGLGVEQTNIHVVISEETIDFVHSILDARMTDRRLKNMGAVVCLMVKPKGRARGKFNPPSRDSYDKLVHRAIKNNIPIGFDSCSAPRFMDSVSRMDISDSRKKQIYVRSDPCESLCFSVYVNVKGEVYSCSFAEGEPGWETGMSLLDDVDFIKDIWMGKKAQQWRKELLSNERRCPIYKEIW